jgi:hypothetical protein
MDRLTMILPQETEVIAIFISPENDRHFNTSIGSTLTLETVEDVMRQWLDGTLEGHRVDV